jgi:hypothetical protein
MLESKRGLWVGRWVNHISLTLALLSHRRQWSQLFALELKNFRVWNKHKSWKTLWDSISPVYTVMRNASKTSLDRLWKQIQIWNSGLHHNCSSQMKHSTFLWIAYSTLHWVSPWKKESEKFPCPYVISRKTFNHAKYLRACFSISPEVPSLPEDSSLLLHLCYCDNNDYLRIKCHRIETLSRGSYERDILQVCTATVCQSSVYFCTQVQSLQKIKKSC